MSRESAVVSALPIHSTKAFLELSSLAARNSMTAGGTFFPVKSVASFSRASSKGVFFTVVGLVSPVPTWGLVSPVPTWGLVSPVPTWGLVSPVPTFGFVVPVPVPPSGTGSFLTTWGGPWTTTFGTFPKVIPVGLSRPIRSPPHCA
ncbi:MAG TPA: hypothetical protein DD417_14275 [Elusimicrobia bacterium]|nr:hypothetical protein [Elusimicrobiota bacterium]